MEFLETNHNELHINNGILTFESFKEYPNYQLGYVLTVHGKADQPEEWIMFLTKDSDAVSLTEEQENQIVNFITDKHEYKNELN